MLIDLNLMIIKKDRNRLNENLIDYMSMLIHYIFTSLILFLFPRGLSFLFGITLTGSIALESIDFLDL